MVRHLHERLHLHPLGDHYLRGDLIFEAALRQCVLARNLEDHVHHVHFLHLLPAAVGVRGLREHTKLESHVGAEVLGSSLAVSR